MRTHTHDGIAVTELEINGGIIEIETEFTVMEVYDPQYGSDADGNRGMAITYFNEPEYEYPDGVTGEIEKLIDHDVSIAATSIEPVLSKYERYF